MTISSIPASAAPYPNALSAAAGPAAASPASPAPAAATEAALPAPSSAETVPTTTVAYNMDGSIVITMNAPKSSVSLQA